jgi:hypothetical protein
MTIPELEARAQTYEERLRLARQAGWFAGFGGGVDVSKNVFQTNRIWCIPDPHGCRNC